MRTGRSKVPTREEIAKGGFTRIRLAEWGIAWPPAKGWRKHLEQLADSVYGSTATQKPKISTDDEPWMTEEEHKAQKGKPPWDD